MNNNTQNLGNTYVEVRKSNFTGKYSVRIYWENENKEKTFITNWSIFTSWNHIKKTLATKNITSPNAKDMRLFSDGFEYSYGEFSAYGKVI